jgi:pilus assembly protein CpaB
MGASGGQEDPNNPAPTPTTFDNSTIATLELNPAQAETLINASTLGQLTLTLRSVVDFNNTVADTPSSNQTVRLIRFGKEQSILAGANPTLVGQQAAPLSNTSGEEPLVSDEPQVVPQ